MPPTVTVSTPRASWPRFAGSLIVLAVIAVGIPAGLISLSRLAVGAAHPLPGVGSWDDITAWMSSQRSSTEIARVALRVLISLCWLLWAALFLSLVSSILASRPRFEDVRLPRLAMFDSLGAWVVAGLIAVASLHPKTVTAAPIGTRPAVAAAGVVAAPADEPTTMTRPVAPAVARPGWAIVQSGESIETVAARTLGDPTRWPELWELNQGRTMDAAGTTWREPWRISAGWQLQLPVNAAAATVRAAPAVEQLHLVSGVDVTAAGAQGAVAVHRIVFGDTLWDIVEGQYGRVDMDLVWFVADFNGIVDPNQITVGTDVQLPREPDAALAVEVPPVVADGAVGVHRIVHGDTLWDIVEGQYGRVDMDLVWFVADFNGIVDPTTSRSAPTSSSHPSQVRYPRSLPNHRPRRSQPQRSPPPCRCRLVNRHPHRRRRPCPTPSNLHTRPHPIRRQ